MPIHVAYRANNFNEIIGNDRAIKVLKTTLKRKDRPHAYLFEGPYGCGKTTLAYLIRDYLKCHEKAFDEINVGDTGGVDKARDLIKTLKYKPLMGPVKVILLDEVHMATKAFQNALSKDLESPPSHVYFLLCTTNPEKILKGIKGDQRCFTFTVKPLTDSDSLRLLKEIIQAENVNVPEPALKRIIELAEGTPRRLMVMLDKIISLPESEMLSHIEGSLPEEEHDAIEIVRGLVKQNIRWAELATILKSTKAESEQIRRMVINYSKTVILNKPEPQTAILAIYDAFKNPFYDAPTAKAELAFATAKAFDKIMGR